MFSFLLVWFQVIGLLHPFHVSVCDVVINSEARSVQISQRIFLDDFELALNNSFDAGLIIDDQTMQAKRDSLIELYLAAHFEILVDDKKKEANYLGSEFEEDAIWCYIEIEGVRKVKSIQVKSTILYSEYDDQANIIHFKKGDFEKSVKLDEENPTITFTPPNK
jgi:hypothetical protein